MITILLHIDVCVYTHPSFLGGLSFPDNSVGKESACNAGDPSLIPGLGRSGEGKGYPLQYSGLENSMDYVVHGVTKSRTRLSDFHSLFSKAPESRKGPAPDQLPREWFHCVGNLLSTSSGFCRT